MKRFTGQYKFIMLLLLSGFSAMGQPFEKSRSLSKAFVIGADTEVQISNKYGSIELIPWDKDSVRVDIDLKVIANKESKLNSTFDYIDFEFKNSKHYLVVQTLFAGKGSFWSDVKDLAGTVFAGGTKTQIDYKVYLPSRVPIKIDNKYGNIYTSDHDGPAEIILSNGDLKSHNFNSKTKINLQFANANIKYIQEGDLDISYYSEIQLNEAGKLKIYSRSSRVNIETVDEIETNSNRDKYYITNVNTVKAINAFTYLDISSLSKSIDFKGNYGDLIIKSFDNELRTIIIDIESTDVSINVTEGQSLKMETIYNERAGLYYYEELKQKETNLYDENKKLAKTTGILGKSSDNTILIQCTNLSGKLRINKK